MTGMLDDEFPMMLEREAGMRPEVPEVAVAFGFYPMINAKETEARGTDVYDDVEHIKVAIPGDRNNILLQPSSPAYRKRFPHAYQSFKDRTVTGGEGAGKPLTHWPMVTRAMAMTLMAAHVRTVEMLAGLSDEHLQKFPGNIQELRDKARAYLDDAKSGAALNKALTDAQRQEATIAALQAQINQLQSRELERQQKEAEAQPGAKGVNARNADKGKAA
jgi:hypothetical protein